MIKQFRCIENYIFCNDLFHIYIACFAPFLILKYVYIVKRNLYLYSIKNFLSYRKYYKYS